MKNKFKILIISLFTILFSNAYSYDVNKIIAFTSERDNTLGDSFTYLKNISEGEIQFFYDNEVQLSKRFTLNTKEIRFIDALKLILTLNNLEMNKISDSVYFIYNKDKAKYYEDMETKAYIVSQQNINSVIKTIQKIYPEGVTMDANPEINSLTVRAKKQIVKEIEAIITDTEERYKKSLEEEQSKSGKTEKHYQINYAVASDIVKALSSYFPIDKYIVDEKSNSFYIMYNTSRKDKIEDMIKLLDVAADQVKVEVIIIDKAVGSNENIGINWNMKKGISENSISSYSGVKQLLLPSSFDLSKVVSLANILASPTLTISNRKESKILVGEKIPIIIGQPSSKDSSNIVPIVDYKDVGLVLKCVPNIHNETGDITLDITLNVNSLGEKVPSAYGEYFRILSKEIISTVRLKDGEQLVFGGLISNEERKKYITVPLLGDIPILGEIFRSNVKDPIKKEVILILKPTILRTNKSNVNVVRNTELFDSKVLETDNDIKKLKEAENINIERTEKEMNKEIGRSSK